MQVSADVTTAMGDASRLIPPANTPMQGLLIGPVWHPTPAITPPLPSHPSPYQGLRGVQWGSHGGTAALAPSVASLEASRPSRDPRAAAAQAQAQQEVWAEIQGCLDYASSRWDSSTVRKRDAAAQRFSTWMEARAALGVPNMTWATATPQTVMAYIYVFSKQHGKPDSATGVRALAAPSSVSSMVSHLSTTFRLLGRSAPWGPMTPAEDGNPADSYAVQLSLQGYRRRRAHDGWFARAAMPWGPEKLRLLLGFMDTREGPLGHMDTLLHLRDAAMFCFMCECGKRGKDSGRLECGGLTDQQGVEIRTDGLAQLTDGATYMCRMFSKTRQERPAPPMEFVYRADGAPDRTNFLWRLLQYYGARWVQGMPMGRYVFTALNRARTNFLDAPMGATTCQKRLETSLKLYGIDDGETLHGLRRGTTGTMVEEHGEEAAMRMLDMRSAATLRLYADHSRPIRYGRKRSRNDSDEH